jgi:hypothetical protein
MSENATTNGLIKERYDNVCQMLSVNEIISNSSCIAEVLHFKKIEPLIHAIREQNPPPPIYAIENLAELLYLRQFSSREPILGQFIISEESFALQYFRRKLKKGQDFTIYDEAYIKDLAARIKLEQSHPDYKLYAVYKDYDNQNNEKSFEKYVLSLIFDVIDQIHHNASINIWQDK